jgi:alanyl-tRNA synthetase
MSVEEEFIDKIVEIDNELVFSRFNILSNKLFLNNANIKDENLALKSHIRTLTKTIAEKDKDIKKLRERLKKQEFLEKNKEIQKESVKIVANKLTKSKDSVELKKTITDLIKEIDVCVAFLDDNF